jgi:hypothetical protein
MEAMVQERVSGAARLADAWALIYGRQPDYKEAVNKLVEAVEIAASPKVGPEADLTLGKVIGMMRGQPESFICTVGGKKHEDRVRRMAELLDALWDHQTFWRHPKPETENHQVTFEEARVLADIALTVVEAFGSEQIVHKKFRKGAERADKDE